MSVLKGALAGPALRPLLTEGAGDGGTGTGPCGRPEDMPAALAKKAPGLVAV